MIGDAPLHDEQRESLRDLAECDTLVVLAPGAGKTAIYALGRELLGGAAVVVSPTLSLQRDQVRALSDGGLRAAAVNSDRAAGRNRASLDDLAAGELDVLLLAPEQLGREDVVGALRRAEPALLVVDEAHCISQWGHDFRPDYLGIGPAADAMGRPRVLALTATAAPPVRDEILHRLGMEPAHVVVGDTDRPGLHLSVQLHHREEAKWDAVAHEVREHERSGIVYVGTRRHVERLVRRLRDDGVSAAGYHGGLRRADRDAAQDAFVRGDTRVMVATSAFGMGIDKPDVRFVLHGDASPSVEAYHQEVGRAGRDGAPAVARLHYRPQDLALPTLHASGAEPDHDRLAAVLAAARRDGPLSRAGVADAADLPRAAVTRLVPLLLDAGALREGARRRLEVTDGMSDDSAVTAAVERARRHHELERSKVTMMRRYAETTGCRRRTLLELLGEVRDEPCCRCDNCDAGHAGSADRAGLEPGLAVEHPDFGRGTVQTVEGESVVVLFDASGYRTLSLPVLREQSLLTTPP